MFIIYIPQLNKVFRRKHNRNESIGATDCSPQLRRRHWRPPWEAQRHILRPPIYGCTDKVVRLFPWLNFGRRRVAFRCQCDWFMTTLPYGEEFHTQRKMINRYLNASGIRSHHDMIQDQVLNLVRMTAANPEQFQNHNLQWVCSNDKFLCLW